MTKFDQNGVQVQVVEKLQNGQYLIRKIFSGIGDDWNKEENYLGGELFVVDDLFDTPPTERLDQKILDLQKKVDDLQQTKREIEQNIRSAEEKGKAKLAKYKKYEQLEYLDLFLDGKITHYVLEYWGSFNIISFKKAVPDNRWDPDQTKLLTLFGRSGDNLQWRLSQYSDGSGGGTVVTPCVSYEHALRVAQDFVDNAMNTDYQRPTLIKAAKTYGLIIDPEYVKKCKEKENIEKNMRIKELEQEIEKLRS